jgi:hypothetical protein
VTTTLSTVSFEEEDGLDAEAVDPEAPAPLPPAGGWAAVGAPVVEVLVPDDDEPDVRAVGAAGVVGAEEDAPA